MYAINAETSEELEAKNKLIAMEDNTVKVGLEKIFNFSDKEMSRFYTIIEEYCGLITNKRNKVKKQMFLMRDSFSKFSIYSFDKQFQRQAIQMQYAFNGAICYRDILTRYIKEINIDNEIKDIRKMLNNFLLITNLTAYTAKLQGA